MFCFLPRMNRLVSSLMACLLAIHALLGCCSHHAHAESGRHLTAHAQVGHAGCGCCEQEHATGESAELDEAAQAEIAANDAGDNDPAHRGHDDCQGVCTFVRGKCVQVDAPQAAGLAEPLVGLLSARVTSCSSDPSRFLSHPPSLHPPVRLHLVHQVLVI